MTSVSATGAWLPAVYFLLKVLDCWSRCRGQCMHISPNAALTFQGLRYLKDNSFRNQWCTLLLAGSEQSRGCCSSSGHLTLSVDETHDCNILEVSQNCGLPKNAV